MSESLFCVRVTASVLVHSKTLHDLASESDSARIRNFAVPHISACVRSLFGATVYILW